MVDGVIYEVQANAFFILPKDWFHRFLPQEGINDQVISISTDHQQMPFFNRKEGITL